MLFVEQFNMSRFDSVYRKFLLTKFFTKGWGKPEHMRRIMALRRTIAADREIAVAIANPEAHPITITRDLTSGRNLRSVGRLLCDMQSESAGGGRGLSCVCNARMGGCGCCPCSCFLLQRHEAATVLPGMGQRGKSQFKAGHSQCCEATASAVSTSCL